MTDITLGLVVTRTLLGLGDLSLNDHTTYYVAGGEALTPQVAWEKTQATSRYMEGAVTLSRVRRQLTMNLGIECMGDTAGDLSTAISDLLKAVTQDSYTMTLTVDGVSTVYNAEAADYSMPRTGPRYNAMQLQVALQIPVQPVPASGVI